jgi:DNA replication factor GINS
MNLDELRSALDTERQKGGLQQLRDSFYQEVAAYVEGRKDERECIAQEAEDMFASPEVQRLTDEIETAKSTAESLYERRLGKLVKQASLAAANMANPDQVAGLTEEERELYEDLVARIEANKEHMLDVVAGEVTTTATETAPSDTDHVATEDDSPPSFDPDPEFDQEPEPGSQSTARADSRADADVTAAEARAVADEEPAGRDGVSAADVMGEEPKADADTTESEPPADEPQPSAAERPADTKPERDVDRTTVRITRDIGEIFGVDEREYTLSSDDVVTLPTANADPLVEREAAEKLE